MSDIKKILVIIDPQVDFMDLEGSALPVIGATADMDRVANLIDKVGDMYDEIHVTLDSHHNYHIAHPLFFIGKDGKAPDPGTVISIEDINTGTWKAKVPAHQGLLTDYVQQLKDNNRYDLTVWPPHCLIGSIGATIYQPLFDALSRWEIRNCGIVLKTTKGSNWSTEHYSAVSADVERLDDPSTSLNTNFIEPLESAEVHVAGEASSHCLAFTVRDIVAQFGSDALKNFKLIINGMSPVVIPNVIDFTYLEKEFFADMKKEGLQLITTEEIIKGVSNA